MFASITIKVAAYYEATYFKKLTRALATILALVVDFG